MSEHSKLPWSVHSLSVVGQWEVLSATNEIIARCNSYEKAAQIVRDHPEKIIHF